MTMTPQEEMPRPPLTDEYVQEELEKCGEPTCYICRLSRDLLETRAALKAVREERDGALRGVEMISAVLAQVTEERDRAHAALLPNQ